MNSPDKSKAPVIAFFSRLLNLASVSHVLNRTLIGPFLYFLRPIGFPIAKRLTVEDRTHLNEFVRQKIRSQESESDHSLERLTAPGNLIERAIEYPAFDIFCRETSAKLQTQNLGKILDIGSTLNNDLMNSTVPYFFSEIRFLNPNPDPSVVLTSIRSEVTRSEMKILPHLKHEFDLISSISTLEHIGFSNRQYGDPTPPKYSEPDDTPLRDFVDFMDFALKPGGHFFVTVPIGRESLNLHPVTFEFASQTFDRQAIQSFLDRLEDKKYEAQLATFSLKYGSFRPNQENAFRLRYGQFAPAASAVAVVRGSKHLSTT